MHLICLAYSLLCIDKLSSVLSDTAEMKKNPGLLETAGCDKHAALL